MKHDDGLAQHAAECERTGDTDAMPELLERLVIELPIISLPRWELSAQLESASLSTSCNTDSRHRKLCAGGCRAGFDLLD